MEHNVFRIGSRRRRGPAASPASRRALPLVRTSFALGALLAAVSMTGCSTAARREIESQRVQAHAEPLELRAANGSPDASIDTDGTVRIDHVPVPLDARQRASALAYREASLAVVDLALQNASRLTRFAVPRALFGMMVHGADDAGRGIEKDAEAIPHSPEFCLRLEHLLDAQALAVSQVPRLGPYANVTRQDVESCRAGRPITWARNRPRNEEGPPSLAGLPASRHGEDARQWPPCDSPGQARSSTKPSWSDTPIALRTSV